MSIMSLRGMDRIVSSALGLVCGCSVAIILETALKNYIFIEPDSGMRSWWISIDIFISNGWEIHTFLAIVSLICCAGVIQGLIDGHFATALPLSVLSAICYGFYSFATSGYLTYWQLIGAASINATYTDYKHHIMVRLWPVVYAFLVGVTSGVLLRALIRSRRSSMKRKVIDSIKG